MGKGINSLRFGLNTFWLGFMHKNKQKHGEKEKNWGRRGNWQSSLLVQRAWKFWTKQPISKLLLHKGRIWEHPGEIHCIKARQASTTDFLFAINTAPEAVTLYSYPGVHCPFIYIYVCVCAHAWTYTQTNTTAANSVTQAPAGNLHGASSYICSACRVSRGLHSPSTGPWLLYRRLSPLPPAIPYKLSHQYTMATCNWVKNPQKESRKFNPRPSHITSLLSTDLRGLFFLALYSSQHKLYRTRKGLPRRVQFSKSLPLSLFAHTGQWRRGEPCFSLPLPSKRHLHLKRSWICSLKTLQK